MDGCGLVAIVLGVIDYYIVGVWVWSCRYDIVGGCGLVATTQIVGGRALYIIEISNAIFKQQFS